MRSNKALITAILAIVSITSPAQKKIGDFIESRSYNDDIRGSVRSLQYMPKNDAFYCLNGENRFTRALYGGYTAFRLETSDRPVFAMFADSKNSRNISFTLTLNGKEYNLEKTAVCEAKYALGARTYSLSNPQWGNGTLTISAICLYGSDAAMWQFNSKGFASDVTIKATMRNISATRLSRNGDLGVDKPGCFEASGEPLSTVTLSLANGDIAYLKGAWANGFTLESCDGAKEYRMNRKILADISGRIQFITPDPYINAIDQALSFAAEGAWDGETWLHGAIGWRMQYNGWRAGYLGDVLGWRDRTTTHFDAFAESQVTNVPATATKGTPDPKNALSREAYEWGTLMYSNGYICSKPHKNNSFNHYDMNLNYIDELLWHFQYDADTAYMRKMWPVLTSHLAWEKRNFDSDNDHLYDAYCCIWASDALYYNGGAVTHSSAYNYRGNLLAARIAELIGEDGSQYKAEAEAILKAMNEQLWVKGANHWAEYRDKMGLRRQHESAALWSIYTPTDCGVGTGEQMYQNTQYVDRHIPHIPVTYTIPEKYEDAPAIDVPLSTISTSDWMPYNWSINNVASAEVMNMVLAYYKSGRPEAAYRLLKSNIMDQMYIGQSPGNFGQISFYDAARGECYRDFSDNTGTSARALLQGLFGIVPQALDGKCVIRPGFPKEWNTTSVKTPYITYTFERKNGMDTYVIKQDFAQPLQIIIRQNIGNGCYIDHAGTTEKTQTISFATTENTVDEVAEYTPAACEYTESQLGLDEPNPGKNLKTVNLSKAFNAKVSDIFKQEYLSPRPEGVTLQIPKQGIGEWCHPQLTAEINDSVFRKHIKGGSFTMAGVKFATPAKGKNIIYTSLWDNYPSRVDIPLSGSASKAYLLMTGSTNPMQSHIDNALVTVAYTDGTQDTLHLLPPYNWCPIEQDYFVDNKAFTTLPLRPYRVCFGTCDVSRDLGALYNIKEVYGRELKGGAAQMLTMHLNPKKSLKSLSVIPQSNDVVIGLMAITLE